MLVLFLVAFVSLAFNVEFNRIVLVPGWLELIRRRSSFHPGWLRLAHFAALFDILVGNFWYKQHRLDWRNGSRCSGDLVLALGLLFLDWLWFRFSVDFLEQVVQDLLVGIAIDLNFWLSWRHLLLFFSS